MLHFRGMMDLARRVPQGAARLTAVMVLAVVALSMAAAGRADAQGTIIIDGNALGRIIGGGIRIEQQEERQRTYAPRSYRPRAKAQSANRKGSAKLSKARRKTDTARQSAEPEASAASTRADVVPEAAQQPAAAGNLAPAPPLATAPSVAPAAPVAVVPALPLAAGSASPAAAAAPALVAAPGMTAAQPAPVAATLPQPMPPITAAAPSPPVQVAAPSPMPSQPAAPATLPVAAKTISSPAEIASAQEHLKFLGYEIPQTGGEMDLKTKIAIMQFQDSLGATTTGDLTLEQLQTLFQKAAARSQGK